MPEYVCKEQMHRTPIATSRRARSVILRRKLVINISDQAYPHLGGIVSFQNIADEMRLDLHLHHLQRAPQHTAEDVGVPELVLRAPIVGQLDKVGEGVLLKDQRELLAIARPICYGGCDVEEDLEADLEAILLLARARPLFPTFDSHQETKLLAGQHLGGAYLGDHLGRLPEVCAALHRVGLGQVVLDQPQPDVVTHLVQLLVDLHVVTVKVLAQLGDNGAVGEHDKLGVDLVDPCPCGSVSLVGAFVGMRCINKLGCDAYFHIL